MKKARLVIAMVIVAMMTSIFSIASAETTVAVTATQGNVGDVVTVSFTLPANSGVYALDMDVVYDATELEYVADSAKAGDKVGMAAIKTTGVGLVAGETDGKAENVILTVDFKVLKDGATVTGKMVEATDEEANIYDEGAVVVGSATIVAPTTAAPTTVETKAEVDDNPNTGVVACTAAVVALAASGVVLVKSKRK